MAEYQKEDLDTQPTSLVMKQVPDYAQPGKFSSPVSFILRGDLRDANAKIHQASLFLQQMRADNSILDNPICGKTVVVEESNGGFYRNSVIQCKSEFGREYVKIHVPPWLEYTKGNHFSTKNETSNSSPLVAWEVYSSNTLTAFLICEDMCLDHGEIIQKDNLEYVNYEKVISNGVDTDITDFVYADIGDVSLFSEKKYYKILELNKVGTVPINNSTKDLQGYSKITPVPSTKTVEYQILIRPAKWEVLIPRAVYFQGKTYWTIDYVPKPNRWITDTISWTEFGALREYLIEIETSLESDYGKVFESGIYSSKGTYYIPPPYSTQESKGYSSHLGVYITGHGVTTPSQDKYIYLKKEDFYLGDDQPETVYSLVTDEFAFTINVEDTTKTVVTAKKLAIYEYDENHLIHIAGLEIRVDDTYKYQCYVLYNHSIYKWESDWNDLPNHPIPRLEGLYPGSCSMGRFRVAKLTETTKNVCIINEK